MLVLLLTSDDGTVLSSSADKIGLGPYVLEGLASANDFFYYLLGGAKYSTMFRYYGKEYTLPDGKVADNIEDANGLCSVNSSYLYFSRVGPDGTVMKHVHFDCPSFVTGWNLYCDALGPRGKDYRITELWERREA